MEEDLKRIQELSDKKLEKSLTDSKLRSYSWRKAAVEEYERRQLKKIGKSPLLIKIGFIFIVLTFIITCLAFFFSDGAERLYSWIKTLFST